MKISKTYREDKNPSKASRDALINFMMDHEESVERVAAKVLARCYPNRFSKDGTAPNRMAHQLAEGMPGRFAAWILTKTTRKVTKVDGKTKTKTLKGGYLVTHCDGKEVAVGHSFWLTFKRFCRFSQAARSDSQGTARRWKNARSIDKETARKHPNRYRNTPRYHAAVEGAPIQCDGLTAEMKAILRGTEVAAITARLERGDITRKMAQAEVLALIN